jgi:hypothetical protein
MPFSSDPHAATPLQQAIEMNNRAASLMLMGQNSQGLQCFQATIRAMKKASTFRTADDTLIDKFHSTLIPDESASYIMKPCAKALLQQTQTHTYIYDHQFLFEESSGVHFDYETLLALYSGTMLFNFGLALHTDGLIKGNNGFLRKSLYIYEMALCLLRPNARCDSFAAVIAVILNNEACIYSILGEFTNAERQFSHLADLLHGMYRQILQVLSPPAVEELYLNTLVCRSPCASQAA